MDDSILNTIKTMVGPSALYDVFDTDLIIFINSVLFILWQLGAGPKEPFRITGSNEKWTDFVDGSEVEAVKGYVYLKTKLYFDPPSNSSLLNAMQEQCKELESRINYAVDDGES